MKNLKKICLISIVALKTIFSDCFASGSATTANPSTNGFTWTENGRTKVKKSTATYLNSQNNQFVKKFFSG